MFIPVYAFFLYQSSCDRKRAMILVMRVWIRQESVGAKNSGGSTSKTFVKGPINLEVIARFHPNLVKKHSRYHAFLIFAHENLKVASRAGALYAIWSSRV